MARSKKIFLIISAIFFLGVIAITIDFSTSTTFPGKKAKLIEKVNKDLKADSLRQDSLK